MHKKNQPDLERLIENNPVLQKENVDPVLAMTLQKAHHLQVDENDKAAPRLHPRREPKNVLRYPRSELTKQWELRMLTIRSSS